jgi:hypothetical protein
MTHESCGLGLALLEDGSAAGSAIQGMTFIVRDSVVYTTGCCLGLSLWLCTKVPGMSMHCDGAALEG